MFRIAILCGGPSLERGISLNSARSLLDHVSEDGVEIVPLYIDQAERFHRISTGMLYSNTPADFDFKVQSNGSGPLEPPQLREILRSCDLAFPCVHGAFGEDGTLQALLEKWNIPFVGSSSETCRTMFNKFNAAKHLANNGYPVLPMLSFSSNEHLDTLDFGSSLEHKGVSINPQNRPNPESLHAQAEIPKTIYRDAHTESPGTTDFKDLSQRSPDHPGPNDDIPSTSSTSTASRPERETQNTLSSQSRSDTLSALDKKITAFFTEHRLARAVVKPATSGSSIGVRSVETASQAREAILDLRRQPHLGEQVLLEPFCEGTEFTVVVLENAHGEPTALLPTSIEMSYADGQFFDYRRKYLPTAQTLYHCPPPFPDEVVARICRETENIFRLFGMRDVARIDGWRMADGRIIFSDFNPISGMEQNSFLFLQASRIGLTHRELLRHIIASACRRHDVTPPDHTAPISDANDNASPRERTSVQEQAPMRERAPVHERTPVRVLFGGTTAERQVSLMSGTNIWLKLLRSHRYAPEPYLLGANDEVRRLPYTFCLSHSVEEIHRNAGLDEREYGRLNRWSRERRARLLLEPSPPIHRPKPTSLTTFCREAEQEHAFIFLALHGGSGENGALQTILDEHHLLYNGSGPTASALCMDKLRTGEVISALRDPQLISAPKRAYDLEDLIARSSGRHGHEALWNELTSAFSCDQLLIKPRADGCSAGIVRLHSGKELARYCELAAGNVAVLERDTFRAQAGIIEMSTAAENGFILEPFIETDRLFMEGSFLRHEPRHGWIELTVGVLELNGTLQALHPSIAVAENFILSLEEKFQGGTGINITPPPPTIISPSQVTHIQRQIEKAARALGIENYARLDIFFNTRTDVVMLIEANTLPGLTPSTVIYHQALAENPPLPPLAFLEAIIAEREERKEHEEYKKRVG